MSVGSDKSEFFLVGELWKVLNYCAIWGFLRASGVDEKRKHSV